MTTYFRTNNRTYRRIYEQHYGPIPKDEQGRSYEIHHIDGNHNNRMKTCEHCNKTVTAPVYGKYHGNKCKSLTQSDSSNF